MAEEEKKEQVEPARLHPVVKATGWVSFFTDLGSELIYPMLPQFVLSELNATKFIFGLQEGLAEGTPAIVKYFAGAWSDKIKNRKWLIFGGYTLSSVVKPFIGLAKWVAHLVGFIAAPMVVLILRVLDKLGKGVRGAPRDAIVADFAEKERGRAFGFQRAMDHAGAVGGGLAAFALLWWLKVDIKWAILIAAIPGLLAVLTIVFFIHDKPERAAKLAETGKKIDMTVSLGKPYYLYLVAAVLFACANSSDAFLLVRAKEIWVGTNGVAELTAIAWMPLAWALLHFVKSITSYIGGGLSDKLGRKPLLLFGWVLFAVVRTGFAWSDATWAAWMLFPIYGIFFGATEGVARAFVADLIPSGGRGKAFGMLGMAEGLMLIPSSTIVGILWDKLGSGSIPLAVNGAFAVAAAVWLLLFVRAPEKAAAK